VGSLGEGERAPSSNPQILTREPHPAHPKENLGSFGEELDAEVEEGRNGAVVVERDTLEDPYIRDVVEDLSDAHLAWVMV